MEKWYDNRIKSALNGTNPMVMKEMSGGFAVFGDVQFLPGYSILLPKKDVSSLNDLNIDERTLFLRDMSILGDAISLACQPTRINYDILGTIQVQICVVSFWIKKSIENEIPSKKSNT